MSFEEKYSTQPLKNTRAWTPVPHPEIEGRHAIMSPSGYSWLGYDEDKARQTFRNQCNKEDGTRLHEIASEAIKFGLPMRRGVNAVGNFVADCIKDNMHSEIPLKYSDACFGTADAIKYNHRSKKLSIYDLKTGFSKVSFKQLAIYAALFCLEGGYDPLDMEFEFLIYQGLDVMFDAEFNNGQTISMFMNKIVEHSKWIEDEMRRRRSAGF